MITANEARNLINDDEVCKYKLEYIEDSIISAAKRGETNVSVIVNGNEVKHRIMAKLTDLGYAVSNPDDSVLLNVSF